MDKLVAVNVTYVKCDAVGCDYLTEDVSNETLREYHNKHCPLCGENLLTDEDLAEFDRHLSLEKVLNEMLGDPRLDLSVGDDGVATATIKLATNGKGSTKIESINVSNGE